MPYSHLTPTERGQIQALRNHGLSQNAIARQLGRAPSTISRELSRNRANSKCYNAEHAQRRYHREREACRRTCSLDHPPLRRYVIDKITEGYSPEQVSGRLWLDYPGEPRMRISHESIYRTLYADDSLGKILVPCLRRRRARRVKRGERKSVRPFIPNRIGIEHRPPEVQALEQYGHWEGDLILGAGQKGAVLTLVERKSMLLLTAGLSGKNAANVAQAAIEAIRHLPPEWRRTITFDNGSEFARHQDIVKATGAQIYFADPYASYQRGKNENTNGLLRQYLPKSQPLHNLCLQELWSITNQINQRPRKNLGFRTPFEVALQNGIALTT